MLLEGLLLFAFGALRAQGKVYELYTRAHFHDMLLDTPIGFRPASLIAFYDESRKGCAKRDLNKFFDDYNLPTVDNLLVARYEISTSHDRVWHEWEDMLDLPLHLGLGRVPLSKVSAVDASRALANESCPTLAFLPAAYANELGAWYLNDPKYTRQNGKLQIWDKKKEADWRKWLWGNLKLSALKIVNREPFEVVVAVKPNPLRLKAMAVTSESDGVRIVSVDGIDNYVALSDVYVGDSLHVIHDESGDLAQCGGGAEECEVKPTPDALGEEMTVMSANEYDLSGKSVKVHLVHELVGATRRVAFDAGSVRKDSPLNTKLIAKRHATTCMTHTRNLVMPKVLPHFHEMGFKKIQMPAGFHQRLKRFYRTHYGKRHVEGWDNVGTQLNCDQVSTHMVSLDNDFSERNSIAMDVIQPILEEWVNASIEHTAFYGMREYHEGAVLRNHVDRVETHVVSSILQIAQTGVPENEPWTLEVYALNGKRMNLALKPGEMVLYEGHALVHGRPKPNQGHKYVNAFCHFKPKDYSWNSLKAYNSPLGKETLELMHVNGIQDIYR